MAEAGPERIKLPCPYLKNGECVIAYLLGTCHHPQLGKHGRCVVTERCYTAYKTSYGDVAPEWETCQFYLRIADCRYCSHYDKSRNWCRKFNKPVKYYIGLCAAYDGPRPPPSVKRFLED